MRKSTNRRAEQDGVARDGEPSMVDLHNLLPSEIHLATSDGDVVVRRIIRWRTNRDIDVAS